jgi:hypothetical protein
MSRCLWRVGYINRRPTRLRWHLPLIRKHRLVITITSREAPGSAGDPNRDNYRGLRGYLGEGSHIASERNPFLSLPDVVVRGFSMVRRHSIRS